MTPDERRARMVAIGTRLLEIRDRFHTLTRYEHPTVPQQREVDELRAELEALSAEHERHVADEQRENLRAMVASGRIRTESGTGFGQRDTETTRSAGRTRGQGAPGGGLHPLVPAGRGDQYAEARRNVDELAGRELLPDYAAERCTAMLERGSDDERSTAAEWLAAAGSADYLDAYVEILRDPTRGHLLWTPEQADAYRRVEAWRRTSERAHALSPDTAGGYLAPVVIDPAVMLTAAQSVSPISRLARHIAIAGESWQGFTSDGVVSEWLAEGAEAAQTQAAFAPVQITPQKWSTYTEYTVELGGDVVSLVTLLSEMMAESRDELHAVALSTGTGVGQPRGLLTALVANAGTIMLAASGETISPANITALVEAVPARYRQNATWLASLGVHNFLMSWTGDSNRDRIAEEVLTNGTLWRRAINELSHLPGAPNAAATAAGVGTLILGDLRQYAIVDRVGTTTEVVPIVLGPNRRPTGTRGIWQWGRTGADVLIPRAFRYLNVPTTA